MDIVLRTGFEAIRYSISFNPETERKRKNLIASGHVIRVEELQLEEMNLIRCSVIRQTSVTLAPYKVQLELDLDRRVTSVSCDCVSNAAGKCKHVFALIHYINTDRSASKTSVVQEWGKPSHAQLGKDKYSKPLVITDHFKLKRSETDSYRDMPKIVSLDDLSSMVMAPCVLSSTLRVHNRSEADRIVSSILSNCFNQAIELSGKMNCEACAIGSLIFSGEGETFSGKINFRDKSHYEFYIQTVALDEQTILDLCIKTERQSDCKEWFTARNVRITSSKAHAIKIRQKKTVESLINQLLYPREMVGHAKKNVKYGKQFEPVAISEYEQWYDIRVVHTGVFVRPAQPWLCVSPDGIVIEDGCITRLLEIKCPISCKKVPIIKAVGNECNVQFLEVEDDTLQLRKSHEYYTQCQLQMYVTGLTRCDLFVWSPKGSCCVAVYKDDSFLRTVVPQLEHFYFDTYLSAIRKKYLANTP